MRVVTDRRWHLLQRGGEQRDEHHAIGARVGRDFANQVRDELIEGMALLVKRLQREEVRVGEERVVHATQRGVQTNVAVGNEERLDQRGERVLRAATMNTERKRYVWTSVD